MKVQELGEFGLITEMTKSFYIDTARVKVGVGDDSAVYRVTEEMDQLITTDMMVEESHFLAHTMEPYHIGYKLGASNISDIAAMGGMPYGITISLGLPKDLDADHILALYKGCHEVCAKYGVSLLGGDTTHSKKGLVVSATLLGEVPKGQAVLRSGARPGDLIGVTGCLGSSAVGLAALLENSIEYTHSIGVHQQPEPQVGWGRRLREAGATSMNDISDGLASELWEIAEASQRDMVIDLPSIPIHDEVVRWAKSHDQEPWHYALHGGEDYQLVFTIPKESYQAMEDTKGLTIIGVVEDGAGQVWYDEDGKKEPLEARGFVHF